MKQKPNRTSGPKNIPPTKSPHNLRQPPTSNRHPPEPQKTFPIRLSPTPEEHESSPGQNQSRALTTLGAGLPLMMTSKSTAREAKSGGRERAKGPTPCGTGPRAWQRRLSRS
jgi:hypothetical protein